MCYFAKFLSVLLYIFHPDPVPHYSESGFSAYALMHRTLATEQQGHIPPQSIIPHILRRQALKQSHVSTFQHQYDPLIHLGKRSEQLHSLSHLEMTEPCFFAKLQNLHPVL